MKKQIILSFALLFVFGFANAEVSGLNNLLAGQKNGQYGYAAKESDKLTQTINNKKKAADAGIIKPAHVKYMGTDTFISKGDQRCEGAVMVNFIKSAIAANKKYKNLDAKTAVYVDGDTMVSEYMPWHPQDVVYTIYDPEREGFGELEIGRNIIAGAVYPSGDAFALSKLGDRDQIRLYHYKAKRFEDGRLNAPFTEVTGYEDSIKYKNMLFKQCGVAFRYSAGIGYDKIEILEPYTASGYTGEAFFTDYFTGDDFRTRFIGDEKIEDVYPQTKAESVLKSVGINQDRKTDKVVKNVIAAKRAGNTTFFTISNIGRKIYIHRFELGKDRRYSVNVGPDRE